MAADARRLVLASAWLALIVAVGGGAAYLYLDSIRWQEAYRAMGVVDGGELAIAQAMVEDEPPKGLPLDERLHLPGTLMRLRYEEVNKAGTTLASYELRALLPPLPYFGQDAPGGELGSLECRERCRQQLDDAHATLIERSGKAGLADEWLLRMPVGRAFALGLKDITIQDIGQEQARVVPRTRLLVTLLETCKADVRVGSASHIEYFPLPLPIPRALRTTQWVQLGGCAAMMAQAPAQSSLGPPLPPPQAPVQLRRSWQDRADWEAVRPARSGALGWVVLKVDEDWLARHGQSRSFHLLRACKFNKQTRQWLGLPRPEGDADIALRSEPSDTQRIAYRFPETTALYFAEWTEGEGGVMGEKHHIVMPSGGDSCRVTALPPAPAGEVLACVPSGMISDSTLVPDPMVNCDGGADEPSVEHSP